MRNLLRAEFFKISKSLTYKLLLIFSFVTGFSFGMSFIRSMPEAAGADLFSAAGTDILYNAALVCIFAADYVCSEFTNRTFAGSILGGAPRRGLWGAKSIVFFIGVPPLVLMHDLTAACMLCMHNGFGMRWGDGIAVFIISKMSYCILCNFAMSSYVLFLAFLVKGRVETAGLGMGSIYVLTIFHAVVRNPVLLKILQFTFVYQLNAMACGQAPFGTAALSSFAAAGGLTFAALFVFQTSPML